MTRLLSAKSWGVFFVAFALLATLAVLAPQPAAAQATVATGSIQGTITDPAGAAVPGAKITVTSKDTGQAFHLLSTPTGGYNTGSIIPGNYVVRVEVPNFKTAEVSYVVQVGVITPGNITLQVGAQATVVEVTGAVVAVNSQQATIQGVLSNEQIENLPVGGRNFLDLAQLEPGVQIQDGNQFDPTKVGYSSISIAGRYGRTARIEVDGVDVSDETVGTTTEDIPVSAIQEFNIQQSTLDASTELTSSGAVSVVTKSGTNKFHGQGFEFFRSNKLAAPLPGPPGVSIPFQRSQYGGNLGGPIIKDKLFFFMDAERTWQALFAPVLVSPPLQSFSGGFGAPFREGDVLGRLDYVAPHGVRMFYRFSYFKNKAFSTFGASSFQPYENKDQTRQHVVGADFGTGRWTHSLRFSYLKFQNNIFDVVRGSSLPFANFPVSMNALTLSTGPNLLAPQETPQSNRQFKYDGSWTWGNHIIRYGFDVNHIQGGGFAKFFGIDPSVFNVTGNFDPTCAGGAGSPLCYRDDEAILGNGQGFSTEKPAFGFPVGGLGPDNRLGVYLGDSWKVGRNLTLTAGLRWDRDTGRTDSDLNTVSSVNQILPGLGNPVEQANNNLAPQVGLAWDPWANGKTVVRMGAGLFYENVIYNNVLFDRPLRLARGAFLQFPVACFFGSASPIPFGPVGPNANQTPTIDTFFNNTGASICTETIGQSANSLAAFETAYQGSFSLSTPGANPAFLPTQLNEGLNIGSALFAPGYKSPRSLQFNVGVQRQLKPGMVLSADFVRNVGTHYPLGVDANHSGDIAFFNRTSALAAISSTNNAFGCGTGTNATSINCAIIAGATMADYGSRGLTSPGDIGSTCQTALDPVTGRPLGIPCAFGGINPNIGQLHFLFPIGRSTYDGLQIKLVQNKEHVAPGIRHLSLQVSYAYSRFKNDGSVDQDFVNTALDNRNPLRYFGFSGLDRRHQLSLGGYLDVPLGFQVGFTGHFSSPTAISLLVPSSGAGVEQIFHTDFTGSGVDGSTFPASGVVLSGTTAGNFNRGISGSNINNTLNGFNNNAANAGCPAGAIGAGCPTPAGQVLINQGLFTLAQLQTPGFGGVAQPIPLAPPREVGLAPFKDFDLTLGWTYRIKERVTIKPTIGFYNLFNFANFDLSPVAFGVSTSLGGILNGSPCSANGTTLGGPLDCSSRRAGVGTGVNFRGAPRQVELGLKITF